MQKASYLLLIAIMSQTIFAQTKNSTSQVAIATKPAFADYSQKLIEASELKTFIDNFSKVAKDIANRERNKPACKVDPACIKRLNEFELQINNQLAKKNAEIINKVATLLKLKFSAAEIEWLHKAYSQPLMGRFKTFLYSTETGKITSDELKVIFQQARALSNTQDPPKSNLAPPAKNIRK